MDALTCFAGRYRIVGRLGEGGMSIVWRAHDDVLDRMVAIKVLTPGLLVDPTARARVQAEARAAAALAHPNVAAVHDYGESTDPYGQPVPYVVMELVDGPSLTDVLADGPVDAVDAMRICADVASGLAAAHARGLVHRDVKPGNVIVSAGGAKLVDFGIAAAVGEPDLADADGVMLGTPAYLAPERLEDGVVVPGSDVYALGLLLYRLLAGTTPWSAPTTTQMIKAHAYLPPRPLPATDGVPAEVADLCEQCLAKNPSERPSAAAVAAVLASAVAGASRPSRPAGDSRSAEPDAGLAGASTGGSDPRARRRRLAVLAALVAVLVAGLFLIAPRLFGGPDQDGSADPRPGGGGVPIPVSPSFPAAGASGAPTAGPNGAGPGAGPGGGPGGSPGATGAGAGVGTPGGAPDATATGPAGGGATPPAGPGPTATPNPARDSVTTTGGSAVVECSGTIARLISWAPADGYEVQAVQPGPNPTVQVKFRAGNSLVSVQATCVDGVPDITVR